MRKTRRRNSAWIPAPSQVMVHSHVAPGPRATFEPSQQFFHALAAEREIFFRATCAHATKTIRGNFRARCRCRRAQATATPTKPFDSTASDRTIGDSGDNDLPK